MRIDIITIFPEYFDVLDVSLIGKARENGIVSFGVHDLRKWAHGVHKAVDDTMFGGGAGMVMNPVVWGDAIDEVCGGSASSCEDSSAAGIVRSVGVDSVGVGSVSGEPHGEGSVSSEPPGGDSSSSCEAGYDKLPPALIFPSPRGKLFTQKIAQELSRREHIIFACGRYEGIDDRVIQHYSKESDRELSVFELSIGDFVLNGGEVASLTMLEAIVRLKENVLGNKDSLLEESHSGSGFLEYPIYTRPPVWRGIEVPSILLSGNHKLIADYRLEQSIKKTCETRPDIIEKLDLTNLSVRERELVEKYRVQL